MWVQLTVCKQIPVSGVPTMHYPGDWVEIGKQQARLWLTTGDAKLPNTDGMAEFIQATSGIVYIGVLPDGMAERINETIGITPTAHDSANPLPYSESLLWCTDAPLRAELVNVGLGLLDKWQVAVPLAGYEVEHLAANVGTETDRATTAAVIGDLRVPMYDTRLMFVRRCDDTLALVELAQSEIAAGAHPQHAFLRALWKVKPVICALPAEWIERGRGRD